jgi:hypothetical protein
MSRPATFRLRGLVRDASFVLALGGMMLPAPLAAQAASAPPAGPGGAAALPAGPASFAPPSAPGIAPGEPHRIGGMWASEKFIFAIPDTPMLPKTKELEDGYRAAMKDGQILYSAWTSCRPGAPSAMVMPMNSIMILQKDADITISFEEPRMTRRIRMNAEHPADLKPSYMGDSVGYWEGDTLVIDTIGFNGQFQLDTYGLPTSPRLHTLERLTKSPDGKRIAIQVTFDDPEYYSAPFTIERAWVTNPDRHQLEYDCSENPRQEEFAHTYFIKPLYRPTCIRYEGKGLEPSKILCRKPEEPSEEKHED